MESKETPLFLSPPHKCNYLPEKESTLLFVDPYKQLTSEQYDDLVLQGFRRSGKYAYRPLCGGCTACKSLRIDVSKFKPTRNQKRAWKKNQDLTFEVVTPHYDEEYVALYEKYLSVRHTGGGMDEQDPNRYLDFLNSYWSNTNFYEFRLNHQLVCVAATDILRDGLSAVYTFYDPEQVKRSIGTYSILFQIQEAQRLNLKYLYLGYWVANCAKMEYKTNFSPYEIFNESEWQPSEEGT